MHSEFFSLVARQERLVATGELGCFPQLVLRDAGLVSVQSGVVMQLLPRDRMCLGTQAQEAPKRGDRIDDMAADFFDDETLDGPDLLPGRVVNSGALNVIALDERVARSR